MRAFVGGFGKHARVDIRAARNEEFARAGDDVVIVAGRPHFSLPFRSLDDVMASTAFSTKAAAEAAR